MVPKTVLTTQSQAWSQVVPVTVVYRIVNLYCILPGDPDCLCLFIFVEAGRSDGAPAERWSGRRPQTYLRADLLPARASFMSGPTLRLLLVFVACTLGRVQGADERLAGADALVSGLDRLLRPQPANLTESVGRDAAVRITQPFDEDQVAAGGESLQVRVDVVAVPFSGQASRPGRYHV